jgi:hypothetical protein
VEHRVLNRLLVTCCPRMRNVSVWSLPDSFLQHTLARTPSSLLMICQILCRRAAAAKWAQSFLRHVQQLDSNRPLRYQPGRWGRARCTAYPQWPQERWTTRRSQSFPALCITCILVAAQQNRPIPSRFKEARSVILVCAILFESSARGKSSLNSN